MINQKDSKNTPAAVPESWVVPEEEIQKTWDNKAQQFARFKEYFKKKIGEKATR